MAKVNIHAHLKSKKNPEHTASVYLHYKYWKVATGLTCSAILWDKERKGYSKNHPEYKDLNSELSNYKEHLKTLIHEQIIKQKAEAREKGSEMQPINWNEVKRRFNIHIGKSSSEPKKKLNSVNNAVLERLEASKAVYAPPTWRSYRTAVNHLITFMGSKQHFFDEIDLEFYQAFRDYLLDVEESGPNGKTKMQVSTAIAIIKKVKQFMRETSRIKRYNNNNPLSYDVKLKKELKVKVTPNKKKNVRVFSIEELKKLLKAEYELENTTNARDSLVIACLTGLRQGDWKKLNLNKNKIINIQGIDFALIEYAQKGKNAAVIPLFSIVKELLKKHGGKFPERKVLGKELKRSARLAGFIRPFEVHKENRDIEIEIVPESEMVMSKSGRHSFSTLCRSTGMPDVFINYMRGDKGSGNIIDVYDHRNVETKMKGAVPYLIDIEKELGGWNYEEKKLIAV